MWSIDVLQGHVEGDPTLDKPLAAFENPDGSELDTSSPSSRSSLEFIGSPLSDAAAGCVFYSTTWQAHDLLQVLQAADRNAWLHRLFLTRDALVTLEFGFAQVVTRCPATADVLGFCEQTECQSWARVLRHRETRVHEWKLVGITQQPVEHIIPLALDDLLCLGAPRPQPTTNSQTTTNTLPPVWRWAYKAASDYITSETHTTTTTTDRQHQQEFEVENSDMWSFAPHFPHPYTTTTPYDTPTSSTTNTSAKLHPLRTSASHPNLGRSSSSPQPQPTSPMAVPHHKPRSACVTPTTSFATSRSPYSEISHAPQHSDLSHPSVPRCMSRGGPCQQAHAPPPTQPLLKGCSASIHCMQPTPATSRSLSLSNAWADCL